MGAAEGRSTFDDFVHLGWGSLDGSFGDRYRGGGFCFEVLCTARLCKALISRK